MRVPRREIAAFTVLAVSVLAFFFRDALLHQYVLGQADLLYQFAPWDAHAPSGWRPGNRLLLDSPTQFVPFLIHAKSRVLAGHLPLWTTALGSGQPFLAAFQTAVLSPFSLLGYLLPIPQALVPIAAARLLVGGIGMFVFLRTRPLGAAAATFGATAFLLNPFSIAWLEHPHAAVAAWLPWLLLTTDRCVRSGTARSVAALATVTALTLLSGHPETAFKVFILAAAYAAYRAGQGVPRLRGLTLAAAAVSLGALLAAVQLVPFFEYLDNSRVLAARSSATGPLFTNPPVSFITAFVPDFFGTPLGRRYVLDTTNYIEQQAYPGLVTWLLASVALCSRRHRGHVWFFAGAALISALVMYGTPAASVLTAILPPLRVAALSRFGFLMITGVVIAAAFGLDELLQRIERRDPMGPPAVALTGATVTILATSVLFLVTQHALLAETRQLVHTTRSVQTSLVMLALGAGAIGSLPWTAPRAGSVAVIALLLSDLLLFGDGLHPLRPARETFPPVPELAAMQQDPTLFRVAGWEDALLPNTALVYGLQDYRSYDAMGIRQYGALLDVGFRFNNAFHSLGHFATPHLLDLLNIKYVVAPGTVEAPRDRFTLLADGRVRIYRNERVMPRAFLADAVIILGDDDARRTLRRGTLDFRRTVVLDQAFGPGEQVQRASGTPGTAVVRHYEDERVSIETDADGARLLVLTDTYYPGWVATLDGANVGIHRANFAFRAVVVPAGRHVVEFRYGPMSVRLGALGSGLGVITTVALVVIGRGSRTIAGRQEKAASGR